MTIYSGKRAVHQKIKYFSIINIVNLSVVKAVKVNSVLLVFCLFAEIHRFHFQRKFPQFACEKKAIFFRKKNLFRVKIFREVKTIQGQKKLHLNSPTSQEYSLKPEVMMVWVANKKKMIAYFSLI